MKNEYDYDAFGNLITNEETVENPYRYAGYYQDTESGLYYLQSRYYNPKTARFITEDTYAGKYTDPLSLNRYTYCHNQPVTQYDPAGIAGGGGGLFSELGRQTASMALGDQSSMDMVRLGQSLVLGTVSYAGVKIGARATGKLMNQAVNKATKAVDKAKRSFQSALDKLKPVKSGSESITVSQDRLQHSVLGEFNSNGRLINGGHGQANINYLNQNNIEYNIVKVYDNGVRVGNIPSHKNKFKRTGTGQAWFPESWTEIDIKNAGEYVANIPENVNIPDGTWVFGEYNGVRVGIIKNNGEIGTIIPDNSRQP